MACLHPIRIINPSKEIKFGQTKYYLYVPCGKCAECQKRKAAEWQMRAYYEAKRTFDEGGFILFDTLTYAPKNLPYLHHHDPLLLNSKYDAKCFNRHDIRLFFVRLRSELTRLGYDHEHKLKYFLSSEYGTDDARTHAPHYHINFFVNFKIDPFLFSHLINKCWNLGRTDGVDYNGRTYVLTKRLFSPDYNPDLVHLQSCIMYTCKYIMKDSNFEQVVRSKIDALLVATFGENWFKSDSAKEYYKKIVRNAFQFHLQSKHFGECALDYLDNEEIKDTGKMYMPDRKLVKRFLQTPIYFQRKLLYTLTDDFRGKKVWKLSAVGKSVKAEELFKQINTFSSDVSAWYSHLSPLEKLSVYPHSIFIPDNFAIYVHLYKGIVMSRDVIQNNGHFESPFKVDFIADWLLQYLFSDKCDSMYHYSTKNDIAYLGFPCIVPHYYGDADNPREFTNVVGISPQVFDKYVICESSSVDFDGFDKVFNAYTCFLLDYTKNKQKSYDQTQLLTKKLKALCERK